MWNSYRIKLILLFKITMIEIEIKTSFLSQYLCCVIKFASDNLLLLFWISIIVF